MSQAEQHIEVRTTHPVSEAPVMEPTITGPATPLVLPPEVATANVVAHHEQHELHQATQALEGHMTTAAETTPVNLNPSLPLELFGPSYTSLGHVGGGLFATVGVASEANANTIVEQRKERRLSFKGASEKANSFMGGITSLFARKPKGVPHAA